MVVGNREVDNTEVEVVYLTLDPLVDLVQYM